VERRPKVATLSGCPGHSGHGEQEYRRSCLRKPVAHSITRRWAFDAASRRYLARQFDIMSTSFFPYDPMSKLDPRSGMRHGWKWESRSDLEA
jgi:hypothetical protein